MARARRIAAALLAALFVVGQLCDAAPSEAEEFWGTVLPNSPLPDAIIKLLHPDTNSVNQAKDADLQGTGPMSRLFPFYFGHRRSSPVPSSNDDTPDENRGYISSLFLSYFNYRRSSSPMVSGDENTPDENRKHMSRLFPFYFGHTRSSPMPSSDDNNLDENTGHLARSVWTYYATRPSPMPSEDDNSPDENTGYLALSGYRRPSPVPSINDDDNTGGQQLTQFPWLNHDKSSQKHSSPAVLAAVQSVFFFHEEALQVGKNMTLYFPPAVNAPLGLLPRNVADTIPFSKSSLLGLLAQLGIAMDSAVWTAYMQVTLDMCASASLGEEARHCATSLEALVEGAMVALGSNDIRPVTSTLPSSGAPLQPYTIRGVRLVEGSSFLACHDLDYPFTIYMCHPTGSARVYTVDVEDADGEMATVVTVCHTDTSKWNPKHLSFKILGTKPGGAPVCHMLPYGNILWAKNALEWISQHA